MFIIILILVFIGKSFLKFDQLINYEGHTTHKAYGATIRRKLTLRFYRRISR